MPVLGSTLYLPYESPSEFTGFNFTFGGKFKTGIENRELTGTQQAQWRGVVNRTLFGNSFGPTDDGGVTPHRSYPLISMYQDPPGKSIVESPLPQLISSLDIWLDISFDSNVGQWFSFATFTPDPSPLWENVITFNVNASGRFNVGMGALDLSGGIPTTRHVIFEGVLDRQYKFREWGHFDFYVDYNRYEVGYQTLLTYYNGEPVAVTVPDTQLAVDWGAKNPEGILPRVQIQGAWVGTSQLHYGLYCDGRVDFCECWNDNTIVTGIP